MDDRQLSQLLRMAAEAERLEFGHAPLPMPAHPAPRLGLWLGWSAAAAAVVIGSSLWFANAILAPSTPPNTTVATAEQPPRLPTNTDPNTPAIVEVAAADPCDNESSVLLAIFRNADGSTSQARIAMSDWDSRRGLNDLAEGELIGFAFEHTENMTADTMPDSVVLLAVTGPSELVPHTADAAAYLAACLEQTPTSCGTEIPCYTSAALQCLPPGVSVRGEARVVR
jgi:hypothetical protein